MGRLTDEYANYKQKNERLEPVEYLHGDSVKEIMQGAVKIDYQTKTDKGVYGSVFEGRFKSSSGKVFELWLLSGFIPQARVWSSEHSWQNHREVLPFNIWAWG
jgi:hypothetical protein